jgi:hypothetical protein
MLWSKKMKVNDIVKLRDTRENVVIIDMSEDFIRHQFIDRPSDQGIRHNVSDYVKNLKRKRK